MKKTIIALAIGAAGFLTIVNHSSAQGTVFFENYSFGASALNAPVTFGEAGLNGANPVTAGERVGASFYAQLLYSLNGGTTYTLLTSAASGNAGYPTQFGLGTGAADGDNANYAGYFYGNPVTIPDYTSGAINFIVQAYNGATYGAVGSWSGQSAAFTMSSIATGTALTPDFGAALSPFTVSFVPVPEPSTLALAGLGGLGMLMAFRRKKA